MKYEYKRPSYRKRIKEAYDDYVTLDYKFEIYTNENGYQRIKWSYQIPISKAIEALMTCDNAYEYIDMVAGISRPDKKYIDWDEEEDIDWDEEEKRWNNFDWDEDEKRWDEFDKQMKDYITDHFDDVFYYCYDELCDAFEDEAIKNCEDNLDSATDIVGEIIDIYRV